MPVFVAVRKTGITASLTTRQTLSSKLGYNFAGLAITSPANGGKSVGVALSMLISKRNVNV
jgi:hypothetical protein